MDSIYISIGKNLVSNENPVLVATSPSLDEFFKAIVAAFPSYKWRYEQPEGNIHSITSDELGVIVSCVYVTSGIGFQQLFYKKPAKSIFKTALRVHDTDSHLVMTKAADDPRTVTDAFIDGINKIICEHVLDR